MRSFSVLARSKHNHCFKYTKRFHAISTLSVSFASNVDAYIGPVFVSQQQLGRLQQKEYYSTIAEHSLLGTTASFVDHKEQLNSSALQNNMRKINHLKINERTCHFFWKEQRCVFFTTNTNAGTKQQKDRGEGANRTQGTKQQELDDYNHCVDLVRNRDREGYLCGLLMPSSARKSYFAIRAFNVELASIKDGQHIRRGDVISRGEGFDESNDMDDSSDNNIIALQLRIRWWRDALDQIYSSSDGADVNHYESEYSSLLSSISISSWQSPIVRALNKAVQESELTKRFLERLIDAREIDLLVNQFPNMNEAIQYAEDTHSSLLYLSLECLGVRDENADTVASNAGIGIGLTSALRSFPFRVLHGENPIPSELYMASMNYEKKNPTSHQNMFPFDALIEEVYNSRMLLEEGRKEQILSKEHKDILINGTEIMAATASSYIHQAQEFQHYIPKKARSCLLPVLPSLQYLSKLQNVGKYDLLSPEMNDSVDSKEKALYQLRLFASLTRSWLTGVI